MAAPAKRKAAAARDLQNAFHGLSVCSEEIAADPHLLGEVLQIAAEIEAFRGPGGRSSTARLLRLSLQHRNFPVTVLQARIDLGLDDEPGAMFEVEDWDDADAPDEAE